MGGLNWALLGFAVGLGLGRFNTLAARFAKIEAGLERLETRLRDLESKAAAARAPAAQPPPQQVASIPAIEPPIAPIQPPTPAAAPPPVQPPPLPQAASRSEEMAGAALRSVVKNSTTGNVVAKVGIIILFFGAAFLVRYAADRGVLPIEYRLMGVVGGALALQGVGWRLRRTRPSYATALQGGAIGLLYLTIFAAFRLYSLLPAFLTFALLLVVVVLSAVLAVLQNEKVLAVLGTSGGFLAPILASTGEGDHVGLFSYYLILNAGIVAVAWFRAWRFLNWIGFVFTFGIGFVWGAQYYQPALFRSTEPFLVIFFLFYLSVAVLFSLRQPPHLRGYVDGSLVFGLPALAFAMQSTLVSNIPFGRAYSAVALAGVYLILAGVLRRRHDLRMLTEAFMALGVVFLTLAVPFAFDGHGTAAAWALEGAGLVWIGVRQQRVMARSVGAALLVGAGLAFALMATSSVSALPIVNSRFLGSLAIAAGGLLAARQYMKAGDARREWEAPLERILLAWGLLWWAGAVQQEVDRFVPRDLQMTSLLLALSASGVLFAMIARRLSWPALMHATFAALPLMWFSCVVAFLDEPDLGPLPDLGWVAWPAALVVSGLLLRFFEQIWLSPIARAGHIGMAWLLWFLVTWAAAAAVADLVPDTPTWGQIAWPIVTSAMVVGLVQYGNRIAWPIRRHASLYGAVVPTVPVVFLLFWVLWACLQDGDATPLPYVPLLNPLEIAQAFGVIAVYAWWIRARSAGYAPPSVAPHVASALAAVSFLALNAVVARIVHFYLGVPFAIVTLIESASFQAGISVLWALTALSLMTLASRRAARPLWVAGAGLLGALVVKLFVADLSQVGAVARIVSFLVTGVLILIIGYVAPVPPKEQKVGS